MYHIMMICSEQSPLKELERSLTRNGFHLNHSTSLEQAQKYYELTDFDLILLDNASSELSPLELRQHIGSTSFLILDQRPSLTSAVEYMANGARYYLPLPTDGHTLLEQVVNAIDQNERTTASLTTTPHNTSEDIQLFSQLKGQGARLGSPESGIIGESPVMQEMFRELEKVACTNATVLIHGESGTGKELVAKALHNLSSRKNNALISVNCAAIPENLIESELFGHEKGAFTGAVSARDGLIFAADKGTLFLDEIGELPLEAQARLLRVLQEGEIRRVGAVTSTKVDIRLVTATHRDLRHMVAQGLFREDLYYRLYVMELVLPPLRERGDDISIIAQTLLVKACQKHSKPIPNYSKRFDQAIRSHSWPGNVRELENAIERAVILSPDHKLDPDNLKLARLTQKTPMDSTPATEATSHPNTGNALDDYFVQYVLAHQNKLTETQLAQSLGISRKNLWERRQKLGIPRKVTN
ncbi:sigma-54-dependent transcriptional regulator [Maribrevibacterium harenarium]